MNPLVDELKREVVLRPHDAAARHRLAEALFAEGEFAMAAKQLEKAVKLDGADDNAHRLLAKSYERAGRAPEALRTLEALARRAPSDASAREALCELLLAQGRVDDALVHALEAARLSPLDPRAHRVAADLYRQKRLLPQARRVLERARALAPEDRAIAAELDELCLELGDDPAEVARAPSQQPDGAPAVGKIGVLGWTPSGGAVSPLEAVAIVGRGQLIFSGNVGPTSREAGLVAFSCLKTMAHALGIGELVAAYDLHLHFTDTEIGKDGPSSGLALVLAGVSAYQQRPLRAGLAATGEITIHGDVKPVGGIHEKIVAAHLAGFRTVLLPRRNLREVRALPQEVAATLELVLVDSVGEAIAKAVQP